MQLPNLFKSKAPQNEQEMETALEAIENDTVTTSSKIKIVASVFIVAFAAYIAYFVQEPAIIKTDVVNSYGAEEISITDFAFDPDNLKIEKGVTVSWINKDSVPHTVTFDNFSSESLDPGESFTHTFNEDGLFEYTCTFHPQMKGTIEVGTIAELVAAEVQADSELHSAAVEESLLAEPEEIELQQANVLEVTDASESLDALLSSLDTKSDTKTLKEKVFATTAIAPGSEIHSAAYRESLIPAEEQILNSGELTESGPENFVYLLIFGAILYFKRSSLRSR